MGLYSGCQSGWVQKKIKQIICKLKWIESEGLPITTEDSDTVTFSGDGTQTDPLTAQAIGGGGSSVTFGETTEVPFTNISGTDFDYNSGFKYNTSVGGVVLGELGVNQAIIAPGFLNISDTTIGNSYTIDEGAINWTIPNSQVYLSDITSIFSSTNGSGTKKTLNLNYGIEHNIKFNTEDSGGIGSSNSINAELTPTENHVSTLPARTGVIAHVDQVEAATTTTPFASAADLNAAYPDAFIGFRIIHESAGIMYIKSGENTWSDMAILNPVP